MKRCGYRSTPFKGSSCLKDIFGIGMAMGRLTIAVRGYRIEIDNAMTSPPISYDIPDIFGIGMAMGRLTIAVRGYRIEIDNAMTSPPITSDILRPVLHAGAAAAAAANAAPANS